MPATASFVLALLITLCFTPTRVVNAQAAPRCYQFDKPYFGQLRAAGNSPPTPDTTSFDRFRAGLRAEVRQQRDNPDPLLAFFADSVRDERTALVRLETASVESPVPGVFRPNPMTGLPAPIDGPHRLVPVFTLPEITRLDGAGQVIGRRSGQHWQALQGDSVGISWFNGYHGPVFRMAVRGDSLVGTVVQRSDVVRRDSVTGGIVRAPILPAYAVRIACSAPPGPG
jgi:hypothetical protein